MTETESSMFRGLRCRRSICSLALPSAPRSSRVIPSSRVIHSPVSAFSLLFPTSHQHTHSDDLLGLTSDAQCLSETRQCHGLALVSGLLPRSVSLCAALVLSYAQWEQIAVLRTLFYQTAPYCRTAFLWNTLMRAQSICGIFDGFWAYNTMVRTGVRPDDHTHPFVLKACSDYVEVEKGREIHGAVFKFGFDLDVYVGNTLIQFYGNSRDLRSARKVFDEMPDRDVISWNTTIGVYSINGLHQEAIELFRDMGRFELRPNMVTIISVFPVCAGLEDGTMTKQIHCYLVKAGLDDHVTVGNALVDSYGKCGHLQALRKVFDEMVEKNEVSWNAIITSLAYRERYKDVVDCFKLMILQGLKPNSVTISSVLPVLVELEFFDLAKEVHGFSTRKGIESDVFVSNSLIDMYAKSGHPAEASYVFRNMSVANIVSWNAMVANFAQNKLEHEALDLLREMQYRGETPNSVTFTNVLPACSRIGSLRYGKEIHARAICSGLASDLFVSNALTDMYAKCACLTDARDVFDISKRDEVSYNILIMGYSQTSECSESLKLFKEMQLGGMKHDVVSFVGAISACANLPAIKQGKEIHGLLVRKLLHDHLFIANSLLDLYTKCGRIDVARKIFDHIPNRDVASWNTMILGYGMLGELDTAFILFDAMRDDGLQCDSVSYIAILSACSHGGLVERGRKYFKEMQTQNIKPTSMHYACMVDLLGRAGLMEEAVKVIEDLPLEPDANILGALLGACRVHGNVELGCWAADHLFKLKPQHCGYYVLLSNMFAEAGRWDDADRVRELMKSRGVKKDPGFSSVQIRDRVQTFVVGEKLQDLDLDSVLWVEEGSG